MIRLHSSLIKSSFYAAMLCLMATPAALANNNGGGNNGGGNNGGGNNNNNNNNNNGGGAVAGVSIDAQGVLRVMQPNRRMTMQKMMAARQNLSQQIARPSKMRKVSLTRLEAAISEKLAHGEAVDSDMAALAGLTRLEYVFVYPDSGDIVIAGPAEGYAQDSVGRTVGIQSGQPTLLLDDLVIALRAFSPQADSVGTISVSIYPTEEGLVRLREAVAQLANRYRGPGDIPVVLQTFKQSLGNNIVTIKGVPAGTHFAHVLTEADYRMKLIGIGLEKPPVPGIISYASQLDANAGPNALVRWFFVPDYESITTNSDRTAIRLSGQGLKLVGENEVVKSDGTRVSSQRENRASKRYTTSFTKHFAKAAEADPVYGQLRNLVDLSIAAAFIKQEDFYQQVDWDLGVLGSEDSLSVATLPEPRQVENAINAIVKGRRLITPIGGGVAIQPKRALMDENIKSETDGKIASRREATTVEGLADGQWWWD